MLKARKDTAGLQRGRSWLFVPGGRADLLRKAAASEADVLVLDLEDSIDTARKDDARDAVALALADGPRPQPVVVRINDLGSPWWVDDLKMVIVSRVDAVMLPKATVDDVERVAAFLDDQAASQGPDLSLPQIVPLIESASGILHAEAIASARRVAAVAVGGEDLAADLAITPRDTGEGMQHARSHVALACAAARCRAIDTPMVDIGDVTGLGVRAATSRALGFSGMLAIHPLQIPVINGAFSPSAEDIRWARTVVDEFERATRSGAGVIALDGQMVDKAVVTSARRLLARAREVEGTTLE